MNYRTLTRGTAFLMMSLFMSLLANVVGAQDRGPNLTTQAEGSRSDPPAMSMKRIMRMQEAQYRYHQEMVRQEYYNWIGYDPMRPQVNATSQFLVPYNNVVTPWVPVSRTHYFGASHYNYW